MRPLLLSLMTALTRLRHTWLYPLVALATVLPMGSAVALASSLDEWELHLMEMSVRPEILQERSSVASEAWPDSWTATLPKAESQLQSSQQPYVEPTLSPEDRTALAESLTDVRLRVKSQTLPLEGGGQRLMAQSVYRPWTFPKDSKRLQSQIELKTSQTAPAVQTPVIATPTAPAVQAPAPTGDNPDSIVFPSSDPLRPSAQPLAQPNPLALPQLPKNPAPNQVNPMGNPLLFPTKPGEVKTNIRQAITLNQAIELALQNNPQLQAARIELLREEAGLMTARSALFPTLSTEFSLSRDSSPAAQFQNELASQNAQQLGGTPNLQRETSTNAVGTLQLIYNIYTGGERGAQIARAEKQVRNGQLQVEVSAEQTRFEATDRYYALQGADAQVAIAQATVEDTSQSLRDARLLEQAGLGTRFDVLRAEGDLATANEALTRSIADQRNARRRLAQILNVGQQVELTAADEIQEAGDWSLPLEQSIVQAYKNRAELEQRIVQSEISEQDSLIALASIKPQVDFLANYDYQNNFDSSAGVVDGYSFAARVRWTFFDGGRAFAQARRAYREMDLAQTQFAQQRDQIRFDVEESYYNLIANKENITSTRTNVVRFEEALRLARLRFQAGVGTQTDVINAQRDLANARGRFLQAIIGYNQSLNSLQRAVSNLPNNTLFTVQP